MKREKSLVKGNKIVHICDKVIEYGIYSLVFFVPIVFCSSFVYDVVDLPKIVVMQFFTLVILLAYVVKFTLEEKLEFVIHSLFLPVILFIVINFLSVINSISPLISIYGLYLINQGFLVLITYYLIYFFVASRDRKIINKMFIYITISATLVSFYGILQKLGYNPLFLGTTLASVERSYSTLGNPIYLSGYLCMTIPIVLGFLINSTNNLKKIVLFVSIIMMYCSLIFTYSRGAYLGFLFSIFIFLIFFAKYIRDNKQTLLCLVGVFIFLFIIFSKQNITTPDGEINLIQRVISTVNLKESASAARIILWKASLKIIRDYPILGTGLETFGVIYPKYQEPSYLKVEGREVMAGKTHNIFLQTAINSGLIGVFGYLWIIIVFFRKILKEIKNTISKNEKIIYISILSGIVAYLIQSQFAFDTPSTGLLFWVYLGSIQGLKNQSSKRREFFARNSKKKFIFIIGEVLIFIILILFILKPLFADAYYRRGRVAYFNFRDYEEAIYNFKKSVELNPYTGLYMLTLASVYMDENKYRKSKDLYIKFLKLFPYEAEIFFNLGFIYESEGNYKKAIKIYEKCRELRERKYFKNSEIYFRLANLYSQVGKYEEAIRLYKKILTTDPEDEEIKKIIKLLEIKKRKSQI